MFRRAVCRKPGTSVHEGLTTANLGRPDFGLMLEQHAAYVRALESLGVEVTVLEADEHYPDSCFVEDVAVVTPACIVMTRSGAPSRRGEGASIEPLLASYGDVVRIEAPGCVDGGDIVVADDRVLIGLSERTNEEGADQLAAILSAQGMSSCSVPVTGALHLKTDINYLGDGRLIVTADYATRDELAEFTHLVVPDGEDYAANCLRHGDCVLMPAGFPGTRELLERAGFSLIELGMSEFQKMDGGLTCLSLRF
jgi:dimethylargininase